MFSSEEVPQMSDDSILVGGLAPRDDRRDVVRITSNRS